MTDAPVMRVPLTTYALRHLVSGDTLDWRFGSMTHAILHQCDLPDGASYRVVPTNDPLNEPPE